MKQEITENSWLKVESTLSEYGELNIYRFNFETNFFLASDHQGYRHILITLNNLEEAIKDNKSRGILINGRILRIDNKTMPFLDITCSQKDNNHVFNLIANDIFSKLKLGKNPVESVSTTLSNWRKFWSGGIKSILTEKEIKGLFGELWFLYNWLLLKDKQQIRNWFGPLGNKYDFELNNCCVEIKTTSSVKGHIHKINGLDQLEVPKDTPLYLYSLKIRDDESSIYSLTFLVLKIRDLLSNNLSLFEEFETKLIQAGYIEEYSYDYEEYHFKIVDERIYSVKDGFPRITIYDLIGGVPSGVGKIEYEINLNDCQDYYVCSSPQEWNQPTQ
ncbi:PD-(D/E)XK motif protein [Priestia aryabhattai]|uniref:PD-(D/E)XK motif protein n=1 Tax=Priestia aryabhattai TaxID=412384 RepID=UPI001C8D433F|nr:PD-(D/E)XK motif protein [Priestia aryabhattai]MBY0001433.1 PD-(D/E)XK motif protein [Priestia aryabhattai]